MEIEKRGVGRRSQKQITIRVNETERKKFKDISERKGKSMQFLIESLILGYGEKNE